MKKSIYLLAVLAITFTACKNETKSTSEASHSKEMVKEESGHDHGNHDHGDMKEDGMMSEKREITETNQKNDATTPIIDAYLKIKNALVNDDKSGATSGATDLLKAFSDFDMTKLSKEQHTEYMDILENAQEQAEHIVKSPIDHQREHFDVLTEDINDIISLLGTEKTLYLQFCPMYNNNKGGKWLSEVKEIKNPYFGSKMLTCGSIKKQIN